MHSEYYYDDPVEEAAPRKTGVAGIFALIFAMVAGSLFIQSTLAGNIAINSGSKVEFGQGITATTACAGSSVLTLTPRAKFINASSAGAFYFSSVTVSNIPSDCNGVDFQISAYDSSGGALPIFNSSSSVATIYDSAGAFSAGVGGTGLSVSSGSGTFTATFDSPVALSSNVAKITIQSGGHEPITYSVGQRGPGGGIVFYVSANYFTSVGSTCNTACKYLEVAPSTWKTGSVADDLTYQWSNNSSNTTGQDITTASSEGLDSREKVNWKIGQGLNNTNLMQVGGATSAARNAALAYAATDSSAGQWFIPSVNELNELCKYVFGQSTGIRRLLVTIQEHSRVLPIPAVI